MATREGIKQLQIWKGLVHRLIRRRAELGTARDQLRAQAGPTGVKVKVTDRTAAAMPATVRRPATYLKVLVKPMLDDDRRPFVSR